MLSFIGLLHGGAHAPEPPLDSPLNTLVNGGYYEISGYAHAQRMTTCGSTLYKKKLYFHFYCVSAWLGKVSKQWG